MAPCTMVSVRTRAEGRMTSRQNDEGPRVRRRTGLHRVDVPSLSQERDMRRLRPGPGGLIPDLRTFLCVTSTVATFGASLNTLPGLILEPVSPVPPVVGRDRE